MPSQEEMSIDEVVDRIVSLNLRLRYFWMNLDGWAPVEASRLLRKSRLDRQVSLSRCLKIWFAKPNPGCESGQLILAWVNLGSLVEGSMKLFLSVYYIDYQKDDDPITKGKGKLIDPDRLRYDKMRQFFKKRIWETGDEDWDTWIEKIQERRNAVHAYQDRDIGSFKEFFADVRRYLEFLKRIDSQLPEP